MSFHFSTPSELLLKKNVKYHGKIIYMKLFKSPWSCRLVTSPVRNWIGGYPSPNSPWTCQLCALPASVLISSSSVAALALLFLPQRKEVMPLPILSIYPSGRGEQKCYRSSTEYRNSLISGVFRFLLPTLLETQEQKCQAPMLSENAKLIWKHQSILVNLGQSWRCGCLGNWFLEVGISEMK